jgi:uncharacterized integral membrane protein
MNLLKKSVFWFVAVIVFLVALLAAADNSEEVALRFLSFETPVWPISWWMLLAFVVGVLFGNLLNLVSNTRLRMNARSASKTAEVRARELDQVRAVSTVPEGN